MTVHKDGRVNRYKGRIIVLSDNKQGYLKAMFSVNGVHSTPRVCRLVAEAFIPNPDNLPQVNHKDENKHNDAASNLEWCTAQYNLNYGTVKERRGLKKRIPVVQMNLNGNHITNWDSAISAERSTGIDHSHIARCCRGKLKQAGGFVWRYAKDYYDKENLKHEKDQ